MVQLCRAIRGNHRHHLRMCQTSLPRSQLSKVVFEPTPAKIIGIYAALLVSHGLVNTFGVHILRYLNNSSIILHSVGVSAFAIAIVAAAPTHQPASFVFGKFYDNTGDPGWAQRASPAYVACIGILMSQYTITGL